MSESELIDRFPPRWMQPGKFYTAVDMDGISVIVSFTGDYVVNQILVNELVKPFPEPRNTAYGLVSDCTGRWVVTDGHDEPQTVWCDTPFAALLQFQNDRP